MSETPGPVRLAGAEPATAEPERLMAMLCYGLFLLALANGITLLIGAVIAYVRRAPARGTLYQSHYANLITVFWVSLALSVLGFFLLLNGMFAGLLFANWPVWHRLDSPGLQILDWHMVGWPMAAAAIPVMLIAWLVFAFWYLWRVVRGLVRALDEKPY